VLDLFRRGETAGVFQFESGGMRSLLMGMQPDRLEDLIAANALFRPGPMDLIPDYNDRKNGRAPVPSVHPVVDRYTAETYGVMVYQEQVMQILHALGGIALREAYSIIKAISKKKEKQISSARDNFIAGAQKNNLPADDAAHLFDLILKFAGYGFNKSHSTGYAIVAYQTAYLKTYFPLHYMAALLTYESVSTDKVVEYMDECRKVRLPSGAVGIEVRPPDINLSSADFTVVYGPTETRDPNHGHIRFGLSAVKGVGEKAIESVITARTKDGPFRSIFDFCERVPSTLVNKAVIEALIKCGAFDTLHGTHRRAAMIAAVETAMSRGAQEADLRNSEDFLFGAVSSKSESSPKKASRASEDPALPDVTPWDPSETLANEKSVLGFFVSSHPLQARRVALETYSSASLSECRALRADVEVVVGGILTRVRQTLVKNGRSMGQKMAMITIEDLSGSLDGVLFSDAYAQFSHLIEADRIVFLVGKIDRRREEPSIIVNRVIPVEEAPEQLTTGVRITLRETLPDGRPRIYNGELSSLRAILRQCPGPAQVYFELFAADRVVILQADRYKVQPSADLPGRVAAILRDDDCCQLLGPPKINRDRRQTLAQGEATVQNRIKKTTDEMCDSIDRY
jgi:DNA polymerase-3 subunit alpha